MARSVLSAALPTVAIEIARHAGIRLILAAAENDYYLDAVAPHVGMRRQVGHVRWSHQRGEISPAARNKRALLLETAL